MKRVFTNNTTISLLTRLGKSTLPHGEIIISSTPSPTHENTIPPADLQRISEEAMASNHEQAIKASGDDKTEPTFHY